MKKINDIDVIKILFDPKRNAILRIAAEKPVTIKEMSAQMGIKSSRLYYHVNKLVESGLLDVHEERMIKNIVERSYVTNRESIAGVSIEEHLLENHSYFIMDNVTKLIQEGLLRLEKEISNASSISVHHTFMNIDIQNLSDKEWRKKIKETMSIEDDSEEYKKIFNKEVIKNSKDEKSDYVEIYLTYKL